MNNGIISEEDETDEYSTSEGTVAFNPTYGMSRGSDGTSGGSASGVDLSECVSVNPTYQFIPSTTPQLLPVTVSSDSLDQHVNGIPIPSSAGSRSRQRANSHPSGSWAGTTPTFIHSSSLPQESHSPDLSPDEEMSSPPQNDEGLMTITSQYSYARHCNCNVSVNANNYIVHNAANIMPNKQADHISMNRQQSLPDSVKSTHFSDNTLIKHQSSDKFSFILGDTLKLDIIIALFSILTMFLSISVIILAGILLFQRGSGDMLDSSSAFMHIARPTVATDQQHSAAVCDCSCKNCTYMSTVPSYITNPEQIRVNKERLANLTHLLQTIITKNSMSVNVTGNSLATSRALLKAMNVSVQGLVPQSDTRSPDLTGLNLPASITVNHSSCSTFMRSCETVDYGILASFCHIEYDADEYFIKDDSIVTETSCFFSPTSSSHQYRKLYTSEEVKPDDNTYFPTTERLKKSRLSCRCYNYHDTTRYECNYVIKRCSLSLYHLQLQLITETA
jgi:hypothetical protein